ncbi:MAG: hypothetical protein IJ566_06755 [Cardiobacteriaceae bacterium]|nr:hypothetical protein [Cardiobacteriaceae bacterium]
MKFNKIKLKIFTLFAVFFFTLGANAAELKIEKNLPSLSERFPSIDKNNYTVTAYKGKIAVDIADKKHNYRTRLREALKTAKESPKNINFAGQFMVVSYGCGTGCVSFTVLDVATGKAYDGLSLTGLMSEQGWINNEFAYEPTSRLFFVQAEIEELDKSGSFVFEFKDGKFNLLEHTNVVKIEAENEIDNSDSPQEENQEDKK